MITLYISIGLTALALGLLWKLKSQRYVSPWRVLIYVSILGSVAVAAGLGLQLWAMMQGNTFTEALKHFAELYPTVLASDLAGLLRIVESTEYARGYGAGLVVGGAMATLLAMGAFKAVLRPVRKAKPIKEGDEDE